MCARSCIYTYMDKNHIHIFKKKKHQLEKERKKKEEEMGTCFPDASFVQNPSVRAVEFYSILDISNFVVIIS